MIPTRLNILGATFEVRMEAPDGVESAGTSSSTTRLIKIDPALPHEVQLETFYHELTHMILVLTGMAETITPEQEEGIAQLLGHSLLQVLSDNPAMPVIDRGASV